MATEIRSADVVANKIRFEMRGRGKLCLCGNSHTEAAWKAWLETVDRAEVAPGVFANAKIGCGNNPGDVKMYVVEETDGEERTWSGHPQPHCIEAGHYEALPAAEVLAAFAAIAEADDAGMDAADAASDEDCTTTPEEVTAWEAARESERQARLTEAEKRRQAAIEEATTGLSPELTMKIATATAGRSRSTRKRLWRSLRAEIGEERTAAIQAAATGFTRRN